MSDGPGPLLPPHMQTADVENHLTSCERVLEYAQLPREEKELACRGHCGISEHDAEPLSQRNGGTSARSRKASTSSEHNEDGALPPTWPENGAIEFRDVSLCYAPDLPPVLCNVSFTIAAGMKVRACDLKRRSSRPSTCCKD